MNRKVDADPREHAGEDRREQVQMADRQRREAERPRYANQQRGECEAGLDDRAERNHYQQHVGDDCDDRCERDVVCGGTFLAMCERGAAGHAGFEAGKFGAHAVEGVLDYVNRVGAVRDAVAGRDVHQQVLAVVRCDIAVAQDAVLSVGAASQSIPRQTSAAGVGGEHPVEHRVHESEIELA